MHAHELGLHFGNCKRNSRHQIQGHVLRLWPRTTPHPSWRAQPCTQRLQTCQPACGTHRGQRGRSRSSLPEQVPCVSFTSINPAVSQQPLSVLMWCGPKCSSSLRQVAMVAKRAAKRVGMSRWVGGGFIRGGSWQSRQDYVLKQKFEGPKMWLCRPSWAFCGCVPCCCGSPPRTAGGK